MLSGQSSRVLAVGERGGEEMLVGGLKIVGR